MKRSAAIVLLLVLSAYACADDFGTYVGRVVVAWNDDGRTMTLVEPFAYVDPNGVRWDAPAGARIDGASIPRFAWSIVGGPYEGKYRAPSVVHDVACNERTRDWQDVHLMFHRGMLAAGVDARIALIMYAAVYHFGPRWPRQIVATLKAATGDEITALTGTLTASNRKNEKPGEVVGILRTRGPGNARQAVIRFDPKPSGLTPQDFEALKAAIQTKNLSIDDVENFTATTR